MQIPSVSGKWICDASHHWAQGFMVCLVTAIFSVCIFDNHLSLWCFGFDK